MGLLLILLSTLIKITFCQFQMPFPSSPKPTQPTTMKNVYQAAPLHYVNIGRKLDGDYKFGYDTGKGPSGQSFREEIRLADGTISGTYGVVDELGHKRVVHFSAGKAGVLSHEKPTSKPTKVPSSTSPAPSVGKPYLNTIARHFTSPLASFNLANYLHLKTTAAAASRQSTPAQQSIIAAPQPSANQNTMTNSRQSTPTQQNAIAAPRQSTSQQDMIASSRHSNAAQQNNVVAASRQFISQQDMIASDRYFNTAQQNNMGAFSRQSTSQQDVIASALLSNADQQNNRAAISRQSISQQDTVASAHRSNAGHQNNMDTASRQSTPTQQNVIASPSLSTPTQQNMIAAVRYSSSGQLNDRVAASRQSTPTQQNFIAPARQFSQHSMIAAPHLYTNGLSSEHQKTMMPFMESYRTGNLERQAKFDAQPKTQNLQIKDVAYLASTYDPKLEDEYYDSAPPFIDIERLSYNIGTDKNASLKI